MPALIGAQATGPWTGLKFHHPGWTHFFPTSASSRGAELNLAGGELHRWWVTADSSVVSREAWPLTTLPTLDFRTEFRDPADGWEVLIMATVPLACGMYFTAALMEGWAGSVGKGARWKVAGLAVALGGAFTAVYCHIKECEWD